MKQFLYILLLAGVTGGCSDNQAAVEGESKTTANRKKAPDDLKLNSTDPALNDVNVDTIGMADAGEIDAGHVRQPRAGWDRWCGPRHRRR